MQVLQTKDYGIFVFRNDNRDGGVNQAHVLTIAESLEQKNMMQLKPVIVNQRMEIIDGQHRVKAAELVNETVWYTIQHDAGAAEMRLLNKTRSWSLGDYMNSFLQEHHPEYLKLQKFMTDNALSLRVAFVLCSGSKLAGYKAFKDGKFEFKNETYIQDLGICWETIGYIRKVIGPTPWANTTKFWIAMIRLFSHSEFNADKWRMNMQMKIEYFGIRGSMKDYIKMLTAIYNYKNHHKINLLTEEEPIE